MYLFISFKFCVFNLQHQMTKSGQNGQNTILSGTDFSRFFPPWKKPDNPADYRQ